MIYLHHKLTSRSDAENTTTALATTHHDRSVGVMVDDHSTRSSHSSGVPHGLEETRRIQRRLANKKYRKKHAERLQEEARNKYAANPEHFRAINKKSDAKNREKILARHALRRAANREKIRAEGKIYYAKNREAILARQAAYKAANPEVIRSTHARWNATHPERVSASGVAWRKANPDKKRAIVARRRAKKRNAPLNDFTAAQWTEMKGVYGHRCVYCHRKMQRLTIDHITPLDKGGAHTASNIVPACQTCNSRKGTGEVLVPIQPLLLTIAPKRLEHNGTHRTGRPPC